MLTNMFLAAIVGFAIVYSFAISRYWASRAIPEVQKMAKEIVTRNEENVVYCHMLESLANVSFSRYDIVRFAWFNVTSSFSYNKVNKVEKAIIEAAEMTAEQLRDLHLFFVRVYFPIQFKLAPLTSLLCFAALGVLGVFRLIVIGFRSVKMPSASNGVGEYKKEALYAEMLAEGVHSSVSPIS